MPRINRKHNDRTCEFGCKQSTPFSRYSDYERHLKEQHLPKKHCPSSGCEHPPDKRIGRLIQHAQKKHKAEYLSIAFKLKDDEDERFKELLQSRVTSMGYPESSLSMADAEHDYIGGDMSAPKLSNDEWIEEETPYYSHNTAMYSGPAVNFPSNFDQATENSMVSYSPLDSFQYQQNSLTQTDFMAVNNHAWAMPEENNYLTPQQNNPSAFNFAT